MQRPDESAGARKVSVLGFCHFQSVRHFRIVIGCVGLRTFAANVQRHIGVELTGILDRRQIAEHQASGRVDVAFHAERRYRLRFA